jgi:hypothetical protein
VALCIKIEHFVLALLLIVAAGACAAADSLPPSNLLHDLFAEASAVVHVRAVKATAVDRDAVYIRYDVSARIVESYKGKLKPGQVLRYSGFVESGLEDLTKTERIVFLQPTKRAPDQPGRKLPWSALEFGDFAFTVELEQWIRAQR